MRLRSIARLLALLVVVTLVLAPAAASAFAQTDHPAAFDTPQSASVSEAPAGVTVAPCVNPWEITTDRGGAPSVSGGATGAYVPDAAHSQVVDAPHAVGATETPSGAEATECAGPFE